MPSHSDGRTHSRSGSGSDAVQSGSENHTFGHPLRTQWPRQEDAEEPPPVPDTIRLSPSQESRSRNLSISAPSEQPSEQTISQLPTSAGGEPASDVASSVVSSHQDISTAPQSLITPPASLEGATDSSDRTVSSWGRTSPHVADHPGLPGPA
jgi:hypothetical protein